MYVDNLVVISKCVKVNYIICDAAAGALIISSFKKALLNICILVWLLTKLVVIWKHIHLHLIICRMESNAMIKVILPLNESI